MNVCLSLLKSCKTITQLSQIHAHAAKTGLDADHAITGNLILLCAVALPDALGHARHLLGCTPEPDTFMYNAIIRGLADSADPHHALLAYADMIRGSAPPDSFTFAFALKGAANARSEMDAAQLHAQSIRRGLESHVFVGTTLVSAYAESGRAGASRKAFGDLQHPNVVAWNALLTAVCLRTGDSDDNLPLAEEVFSAMPYRNQTSWNIMLAGYAKAGALVPARRLFHEMPQRDPISWSTMITGLAGCGWFMDVFQLLCDQLRSDCTSSPNETSLTGVLSACAQAGAFEFGRAVHGLVTKCGLINIVPVANALLDTYAKCGNLGMARGVFDLVMERKSLVSWSSMIAGLAMHGHGEEALEMFHEMEDNGIRPDGVTFISILYACSHAGMVSRGHDYFLQMQEVYGVSPSVEHYGCMVDLYGRGGQVEKAYEFIRQMPMKPNAVIWRTLLGACSIHRRVELAELVNQRLAELDAADSGDHVLLSNTYAAIGEWAGAEEVRAYMSRRRLSKTPGWSCIEVDKVVYAFVANDEEGGAKEEAHRKLAEIMMRVRKEGYIPETGSVLYDIEDEEKWDAVSRHSEKLAVAFGIARLCHGSLVRVVKNLRMCRDCHSLMKLVSKIYEREIVVRDRSRFHSFKEGGCSCKDFW